MPAVTEHAPVNVDTFINIKRGYHNMEEKDNIDDGNIGVRICCRKNMKS